ncbi:MAG: antitoxin HicB [Dehalococcoides mccartyi]|uniref:type II toxin-antitoxin system HicB family antitoxin n=1 Tax=Dehalococcoides mccartyi TaxID=61435 RepID=UPI000805A907|nr:type II toxin-antitoxin system HicB family antitoxin [Dehalococcoides mccartyi]OBW61084.1 MAG: antitoxin HicB [Dehalococcoides mccartyi]
MSKTNTTKRQSLEYYLNLEYPIKLIPSSVGGYVVEIEELPGCLSEGDTSEEALANIQEARQLWVETAYEDGMEIPLPSSMREYNGKFLLRMPVELHAKLDREAEKNKVSLNMYMVSKLAGH